MSHVVYALILAVLLTACSSKEERSFLSLYEKNKNYHVNLQKTEKIELKDGAFTKVLLTATYMYVPLKNEEAKAEKKDTRDEVFIIGLYFDGEEEEGFSLDPETLTLEEHIPISVKALKKSDPRLKSISFVSEWTQFYLVTFAHTDKKSFTLNFENERYGKGKLHFAKVAKYVLTKEAF